MTPRARRALVLLATLLLASCAEVGPPRSVPVERAPAGPTASVTGGGTERFSARRAMGHVRRLAGRIGPRPAGSRGYRRATRHVWEALERYGYTARRDRFTLPDGTITWNVVARWPGTGPSRVILGGHLDTVPGSPGANDNASGVATVLELARVLADTRRAPALRLVAFGAEELQPGGGHHFGSRAYVRDMSRAERREVRAMVSVDMIGKVEPLIVGWLGQGDRGAVKALLDAARRAHVPAGARVLPDWSDNGPFERAGMPAALLWTGFEPNHHEPTDVVGNVAPRALRRSGKVLRALVRAVA